jgi:glycosyltransferase involved in cell wall biosynthesis
MLNPQNPTADSVPAGDPLITISICTYNRAAFLQKTLAALLPQLAGDTELLLVDNASTDSTPAFLAGLAGRPAVKICREEKLGLSLARNTALAAASGEFVIFLDDDALVQPGWLAGYQKFFSHPPNDRLGGAGGAVEPEFEIPPPAWVWQGTGCVPEPGQDRVCAPGDNPWGCNFAVRRAAAIAAGGFNPVLGHRGNMSGAYEEVELLDRVRRAGYEVWWVANVGVRHFIEAKRLRLAAQLSAAFRMGGCRAVRRLDALPGARQRTVFTAGRVLIAPFHCLLNVLLAALSFPFRGGAVTARALVHAASITGLTCKLVTRTFGR